MEIGEVISGRVVAIKPYGAFIELPNHQTGLIHISEIKSGYVDNINNVLKIGQEIAVQVIDFDEYSQKASLSLRSLEKDKTVIHRHHRFSNYRVKKGFKTLEAILPEWIDEAMTFLKHTDNVKK